MFQQKILSIQQCGVFAGVRDFQHKTLTAAIGDFEVLIAFAVERLRGNDRLAEALARDLKSLLDRQLWS